MSELTYEQEYEIDIAVVFADRPIQMTYFECGSHQIQAAGQIDLEEARRLHRLLGQLPGIKDKPGAWITRQELINALVDPAVDALVNNARALVDHLCDRLGVTS